MGFVTFLLSAAKTVLLKFSCYIDLRHLYLIITHSRVVDWTPLRDHRLINTEFWKATYMYPSSVDPDQFAHLRHQMRVCAIKH
jgi:hypothetical protein